MKFKLNQIYYNAKLDFLFLVTDVDKEFNRARFEHGDTNYPSDWITDIVYIGTL